MVEHTEGKIRDRAYQLWEANGCAEGQDWNFWLQAEQEILGDPTSVATGSEQSPEATAAPPAAKPATKRKTATKTKSATAKTPAKPRARKTAAAAKTNGASAAPTS